MPHRLCNWGTNTYHLAHFVRRVREMQAIRASLPAPPWLYAGDTAMPNPDPKRAGLLRQERRRQLRMLLLLAAGALLFTILRAGPERIFNPGWWRLR
jgi:hypothetical protein